MALFVAAVSSAGSALSTGGGANLLERLFQYSSSLGDLVDQDGEYVRFRGRASEVINVGGEKVHPSEVEEAIRELDDVVEVVVYGRENAITGQVVAARVQLRNAEDTAAFRSRLRRHCRARLAPHEVPIHVECVTRLAPTERFKKPLGRGGD